ncbi:probable disease resistance protein At4g27220 [Eucalyptus grandis]|uniref:probable disease resistance protein At4g27220 n=1 Tax=Eucalyptus grandis TaxID=71139 RepID=UPI00192EEA07|nr:probable disease resistance protein At4g27220 [Eucalyptus grandis]
MQALTGRESDILTEVEYAESRLGQKRKREVEDWLRNFQRFKGDISGLEPRVAAGRVLQRVSLVNQINQLTTKAEELIEQGGFSGGLTHAEEETNAYELVTKELVGEAFGQNLTKVLSRLRENDVLTVGIYGMGGVGKTTLVTHIHNRLLEEASAPRKVRWVTVSQERNVLKLQQMISECFNHALREKKDKIKRAAELSHLLKRESTVIILDDLWHTYDPQEVGIPLGVDACKLILTTRSLDICRHMECDELIKLESLPETEAWQLFVKNLGRRVVFTPEVESVAKSVAKECAGLPLGIVVVSGSMRGKEEIHEWRSALKELKEARFEGEGMEDKVFRVLKFSFIRLNDPVVQRCFLHLALYPEDFKIETADLLRNLVYLDFFSDLKSLEAQYDRGHTVVNKLVNVCLLERSRYSNSEFLLERSRDSNSDSECLKMHDLVRDMAINMMGSRCMVKAGLYLSTLPAQEEWVKDLEIVSLIRNSITEIPAVRQQSWALPRLLELHMSRNFLRSIDDSFFGCMPTLQVLDLSRTSIVMLPNSISNLVNLTHLLLRFCSDLCHMPSLAKLKALRTLDLYDSGIEEVPEGLQALVNLRCLDFGNSKLKRWPPRILPKLSNLQTLRLYGRWNCLRVQAREIMSLSNLFIKAN